MEFKASVVEIHRILRWIIQQLEPMQLEAKALRNVELASEEALANIIKHGYKERQEKIEIHVRLFEFGAEIVFEDQAPPFNPLEVTSADFDLPLEERQIGGLGIHFMRKCVDEIRYQRVHGKNVLTFVITRSSQKK